ncbi:PAQR family membrane homeostasis protein TrhA [Wenxinia marina]|uniref:Putative membrane protein, hemolysin III-like protein n=1 Tax=Wenxinia marina DSM 24838 TaxID=1123501 RepID=A0A0D0PDV1_9RHOB|nr:hemolysin III family protein [Wenxinia marina]KIQ69606.1 putative membrane protein, hemolysin III-like protein [Wenxinia marina DSM 24838]
MMQTPGYIYPDYTRDERIADALVHVLGIALGTAGTATLLSRLSLTPEARLALTVYGAAITLSFVASALYHFPPVPAARPLFRRLDHAAIFLKIAGTVTPLAVLAGTTLAHATLWAAWTAALAGALVKLFLWRPGRDAGLVFYLALAWPAALTLWPLAQRAPVATPALILLGAALYLLGLVVFLRERLRFAQAIWHGLVLAATAAVFAGIANALV